MSSGFTRAAARWGLGLALLVGATSSACTDEQDEAPTSQLDTRLETHAVLPGQPSAEGLAYVQAMADAHRQADRSSSHEAQLEILHAALELEPPARDGTAELLHYELVARTAELHLARDQHQQALDLLAPRLEPTRSLPIDRAAARCLVNLGDAAAALGDHGLAMSSYARALEMLTLLLEEVES